MRAVPPAAGLPAAAAFLAAPPPPRGGESRRATVAWTRALAVYRRAEARLAALRRQIGALPPEGRAFPASEPLEDRFDDLECARLASLRRLLRLPAPNLPALALKIALTVDDQAWELSGAESFLATLKGDAHRLCHGG
ncbi:MAG: hypothetical protein E6G94_08815 [Alphaproteobacteria bacterium]|nr:MAG: hypothetical protein E6G94_08815 [Alphaproteobacteria bacterium]